MSENTSTRNSRLPAPKSGLKPPQINVGNTSKRQIDAVSNSSSASGSIPKRQKTNVSNLTKVIKPPQIKATLVPTRPLRSATSISNLSLNVPRSNTVSSSSNLSVYIPNRQTTSSSNGAQVTFYYIYDSDFLHFSVVSAI